HDACLERFLRAVIAGSLAIFGERPIAPDRHALLEERPDIRLARQEPQHLARCSFPEHPLSGQQWNAVIREIKPGLMPEHRSCANAGAIDPRVARLPVARHALEVLPFPRPPAGRGVAVHGLIRYRPKSPLASPG